MINYHQRLIPKSFDTIENLGYKNLVVSGCSFTYNFSNTCAISWPYYIRDLLGFDQVYDSSLPGGGNYHIAQSTKWVIETQNLDPKTTFVVVMWSGADRDDIIANSDFVKKDFFTNAEYKYNPSVSSGVTGGTNSQSNVKLNFFKDLNFIKTQDSRAIENYLLITGLWHYLKSTKFKFAFLEFVNPKLPNRSEHFDIAAHLPVHLQKKYKSMFADIPTIYEWSVRYNLLANDEFHPNPDGHLKWCREVLAPYLIQLNIH